jgi:4-amino-4-deoxy-L-arabinose transferase-like glycosyltransferase
MTYSIGSSGSQRSVVGLVAIVAVAAAIRGLLFRGFVGLDDAEYARFAYEIAHGFFDPTHYTGPAVFPLRLGVIVPTALVFKLFGMGERTTVIYPFLVSLAGIVLIYVYAGSLFGRRAGLIAGGLTAIFPWDIDGAIKLLPDLPAAFYAAAAVTTVMLVEKHGGRRRSLLFAGGTLAGLTLGLSWLCKESVAYLAPLFLVWMVLSIRRRGSPMLFLWAGVAIGSLSVLFGEMIAYHSLRGDLLFRFHEVERNYRQWENGFFTQGSDFGWQPGESRAHALWRRLIVGGPRVIFLSRTFLYVPLVGLAVTLWAWWRHDATFVLPGIWFWSLVLMFNFSSSSTTSYEPLALFQRYLSPVFFPAIVLVSGFLAKALVSGRQTPAQDVTPVGRAAGWLAAIAIVWVGGTQLKWSLESPSTWMSGARAMSGMVAPSTAFYADALTLRALDFFEHYPDHPAWRELGTVPTLEQVPQGSMVFIDPAHIQWLDKNAGMWVAWPQARLTDRSGYLKGYSYNTPPGAWTRIWQDKSASLYRVGEAQGRGATADTH